MSGRPVEKGAPPPRSMPADLVDAFTRCGSVHVHDFYVDDTLGGKGLFVEFGKESFDKQLKSAQALIAKADAQKGRKPFLLSIPGALGRAAEAMRRHRGVFAGARVAVFGSQQPTYETLALALGAESVTVFEYQVPKFQHPRVVTADARALGAAAAAQGGWPAPTDELAPGGERWLREGGQFDVALSVSSFDHDGLGRYGDPLCPDGDLRAMDTAMLAVRPGGLLFVSVPVGPDAVAFNLMRRYGRQRLPLLLEGWTDVDRVTWEDDRLDAEVDIRRTYEPVFVLRKPAAGEQPTDWLREMRRAAPGTQDEL
ncbi:unnamed protein product [Symbiodinium sp. KB8]|nr:unnamed protein product [Symbiodinium sp. KB8]